MTCWKALLCALALTASAFQTSLAEGPQKADKWLKYSYYNSTDMPHQIIYYDVLLYPNDSMEIMAHMSKADVTFKHHAAPNTFLNLSKAIGTKWPSGTVQEYQCNSGLDHDLRYKLIFSSVGQHVSTSWHYGCMDEAHNIMNEPPEDKALLHFSNKIQTLLNIKGIEKEMLKRNVDADNQ